MKRENTLFLTTTAMFIALVYIFTAFINVRLPISVNGGLIHLGNVPLFIAAMLFGKKTGALAGGIGMGLFDLLSGWTLWAPFTFVIAGLMGWCVGSICEKHHEYGYKVLAVIAALGIKIAGYYIAEGIIYQNWIVPMTSIPGNIIQVGTAGVVVLMIIAPLSAAVRKTGISFAH